MKLSRLQLIGVGLMLSSLPAFAGGASTITVDEYCHGTLNGITALPCGFFGDPGPGGLASVMTYGLPNLGAGYTPGDIIINEPAGSPISDIVRILPISPFGAGFSSLIFYSDNIDGVDEPADVGFPGALQSNLIVLTELGPEGNNGVNYVPATSDQPGFNPNLAPTTFQIISDSAPEPGSVLLVLAGAGLLLAGKSRGMAVRFRRY